MKRPKVKRPKGKPGCATYKTVWFAGMRDIGHRIWTFPCPYCLGHWT